eukprot:1190747-Prorocentrum_minimum.AAC.4
MRRVSRYIGLYTSELSQTRGFHSPRYRRTPRVVKERLLPGDRLGVAAGGRSSQLPSAEPCALSTTPAGVPFSCRQSTKPSLPPTSPKVWPATELASELGVSTALLRRKAVLWLNQVRRL